MQLKLRIRALATPLLALLAGSCLAGGGAPTKDLRPKETGSVMADAELAAAIKSQLEAVGFPETEVKVEPWPADASKRAVYFISASFADLYPRQRFHAIIHALPDEFYSQHLSKSVWFELAPGERPEDLWDVDEEEIARIAPKVMQAMEESGFFAALEDVMYPASSPPKGEGCHGDFRISKRLLAGRQIPQLGDLDGISTAHHVLMSKSAYCDCEIILNAYEGSRTAKEIWTSFKEASRREEL